MHQLGRAPLPAQADLQRSIKEAVLERAAAFGVGLAQCPSGRGVFRMKGKQELMEASDIRVRLRSP